ncbi:MAG: peptidase T [Succinivibrio sp.]|jgi:tripeptide aminopeptidase|nr:peptidase T [Succinivibrio sp.]
MKGSLRDMEDLCGVDPLARTFRELARAGTQSDDSSKNIPSTVGQLRLGAQLASLIGGMGFKAEQDEKGVVTACVSASPGCEGCERIALIAHLDTAPDAPGEGVEPRLVKNYDGGSIELDSGLVIDNQICPQLPSHKGDDIIVTDGVTLLGADDKAGVAVILEILRELSQDPSFKHPEIRAVFSVDEEIGRSADYIDVKKLGCAFGITVDGGEAGELDTATFSAEGATVKITGRSVHTAVAYKTMVNACEMAARFMQLLPRDEKPENTRGTEGFFHVHNVEASTASAKIRMIIRDFDKDKLLQRVEQLEMIAELLNREAGYACVSVEHKHQYANMGEVLKQHPEVLERCRKAYEAAGVLVRECAVRGGTDGSNLSGRGLPCPNFFTGGLCAHGPYECLPVKSLHRCHDAVKALIEICAGER